jgi:ubiquinone/menaquinone biosynthesis C-methylase UbiE
MTNIDKSDVKSQYASSANLNSRINLHRLYSANREGWSAWVYRHMNFPPGAFVLELGCGTGQLWFDNQDRLPTGVAFTISDLSAGMVSAARSRITGLVDNFRFCVIDAEDLPFEDQSLDILIANHMLYHVPDLEKTLSEIRRVLKIGGTFYATTVGERHLAEISEALDRIDPRIKFNTFRFSRFNLQNGPALLGHYLDEVERRDYEDRLEVTRVADIIQYILSSTGISNAANYLPAEKLDILRRGFLGEIQDKGFVQISKQAGIIIGKRGNSNVIT